MKELVHILTIHDLPSGWVDESPNKEKHDKYHEILSRLYDGITEDILELHSIFPFKHVYAEAYNASIQPDEYFKLNAAFQKPIKALVERNVKLQKTEHIEYDNLTKMLAFFLGGYREAYKFLINSKTKPVEQIISVFSEDFPDYAKRLHKFFQGLKTFDVDAARDNWIGYYINQTLQENERGILFLGGRHDGERICSQIKGVKYTPISPFQSIINELD